MIGMILIAVAMIPVFFGWALYVLAGPIIVLTPLMGAAFVAANGFMKPSAVVGFTFHDECLVQILAGGPAGSIEIHRIERERLRELFLRAGYLPITVGVGLNRMRFNGEGWSRYLAVARVEEVKRRNRHLIACAISQTGLVAA